MIARAAFAAVMALWTTADAEAPAHFLRRIYVPYLEADDRIWPTGPLAPTIFDAHLVRRIRKDQAAHKGEVGALDQDPICACQDFGRLTGLSIQIGQARDRRRTGVVRFFNDEVRETLRYELV